MDSKVIKIIDVDRYRIPSPMELHLRLGMHLSDEAKESLKTIPREEGRITWIFDK